MFYNKASFAFEIEETKVILEYVFGPRFGRGLEFTAKYENNQITLADKKHIWAR